MKRKLSALILVLVVLLNLLPLSVSATVPSGLSVSAENVTINDTFALTLTVPAFAEQLSDWQISIDFDKTAFEVVTFEPPTVNGVPAMDFSTPDVANASGQVTASYLVMPFGTNKAIDSFTVDVTFKVKETAVTDMTYYFELNAATVFNALDGYVSVLKYDTSDFDITEVSIGVDDPPPPEVVYVGGVEMNDGDYLANGASAVITTAPTEGGYAYLNDGVLTLNNYEYEGVGFEYDTDYYAIIYSTADLEIVLIGENELVQTDTGSDSDSIDVWANLIIKGTGSISLNGSYGIFCNKNLTINSGEIIIDADYWAISAFNDLMINGGTLTLSAMYSSLYSDCNDITINGGSVDAKSLYEDPEEDEIYEAIYPAPVIGVGLTVKASTEADGALVDYDEDDNYTYDRIVITPATYTVSFNANGQGTAPATQTITHGQKATAPTAPTATGYTFGGWYTDAACTTAYDFATAITGNITLYAKWTAITYTVTFNANGGTGTMADVTGISGDYTLPATGFTAPAGKQFKAWSVGGAEKAVGATINVTADTTVTAIWEDIPVTPPTTYTVSFNANGGTGTMADVTGISGDYTLPATGFTAPTGKQFKAWSVGGVEKNVGEVITVSADTTVTAVWEDIPATPPTTYTVTFNANGGSGTMAEVTGISGNYTLPANTFTAPTGKQFKAWSVGGVEKNVGDVITVSADTTVTAVWEDIPVTPSTTYTVSFNANGGTGTMADVTGISGDYTLPATGFTAPTGKQFKAWSVGGAEKAVGATINVTADTTVTAIWEDIPVTPPTTYTVSFNANGHGTAPTAQTVVDGQKATEPTAPTATGYTFGGWYTDAACTTAYDFNTAVTANITLYAKWAENVPAPSTVTELENDATGVTLKVPAGSTATIPAGTILNVVGLPTANLPESAWNAIAAQLNATPDVLAFYDLSLTLAGSAVRPNGKVLVTLTVNTAKYDTVLVYYIADNGSVEACVTTVNANGTITFETDHFSKYAVIGTKTPVADPAPDTNTPDTNTPDANAPDVNSNEKDGMPVGAVIAIVIGSILVLGVGGFAIFWFVIKKKTWADLFGDKPVVENASVVEETLTAEEVPTAEEAPATEEAPTVEETLPETDGGDSDADSE